jgi:hypothetical protein
MLGKDRAAVARRNEVGAHVAERAQAAVLLHGRESADAAARDVLEKDTLHWILAAKREDLLQVRHHQHGFIVTD